MSWYKPWTWGDESSSAKQQRQDLGNQGGMASAYGDIAQQNYGKTTAESEAAREMLRRRAMGEDSLSAEQLRQGLQQQLAQQRSMAASASPGNAVMAARSAANNMARASYGMSGQQAMAGIAERQAAADAYNRAILEQRGQDVNAALGSRQNAINAYSGQKPEGSFLDKWGTAISSGLGYAGTRGGGGKK